MKILGIWDGHDSGAALIVDGKIDLCLNEERLTRRKLEVHFPHESIRRILSERQITPEEIDVVTFSTTDPAKTLTRYLPQLKENYYLLRRRKAPRAASNSIKRAFKYFLTELKPNAFSSFLSTAYIQRELKDLGLTNAKIVGADHHLSHAASAAFCSGFQSCAVISLDGVGDGSSGGIYLKSGASLVPKLLFPPKCSIGIFFEYITQLLNMRELEDEGKVMALANYSEQFPWEQNPIREALEIREGVLLPKLHGRALQNFLAGIHWRTSAEAFSFYAQQAVEEMAVSVGKRALEITGLRQIAYAGGVAANVKANLAIKERLEVKDLFVTPHMGDGGLALGAALLAAVEKGDYDHDQPLISAGLGLQFSDTEIEECLKSANQTNYIRPANMAETISELISSGEIVFWFQDRMEFGPRALGNRSILARADSPEVRDRLNISLKKRCWFQPFCPSMLTDEAIRSLDGFNTPERFMTVAYRVKPSERARLSGVTHVDGTCRPQVIDENHSNNKYYELIKRVQSLTGVGAVLNTSFNLHGEPLVCSPSEAISTFRRSGADYLAIGNFLLTKAKN